MKPPWLETDLLCPFCDGRVLFRFDGEEHIDNLETRCANMDIHDHPAMTSLWDEIRVRIMFGYCTPPKKSVGV